MSSMQVDTRERGFSYSFQAPLDMRMDPEQELSAREIVAEAVVNAILLPPNATVETLEILPTVGLL